LDLKTLTSETQNFLKTVPGNPSTLPAVASIRESAVKHNVDITDFHTIDYIDQSKGGNKAMQIDLNLSGSPSAVLAVVEDIKKSSPLMKVIETSITKSGDQSRGKVTVLAYWSPLPTDLGKVDQELTPLKKSETDVISQLETLKRPEGGDFSPSTGVSRAN